MDIRTGKLYPDIAAALADGVPKRDAVELERLRRADASDATLKRTLERSGKEFVNLVRVTKGPFKGRVYERLTGQVRRRRDLEKRGDQEKR